MEFIKHYKKEIVYIIIIIFLMALFISSMHVTLFSDEAFSLGLVKFNVSKLIYLDSLDVHPPLYYLLLKPFLFVTTFYTNNFYIKVIAARILSIIFSSITFIVLYNINNYLDIRIKLWKQIIIYLFLGFLPFISMPNSNFVIIRMYPLAAMLVSMQFYEIIKFKYTNDNFALFLILILAILSFYTHYISAIISGLMILLMFIWYVYQREMYECLKFIAIGILSIVFYIPWILIAFKQVTSVASGKWWMTKGNFIVNIIIMVSIICIFSYAPIKYFDKLNNKCKFTVIFLFNVLLILIVLVTIISLMRHPMFQTKYAYPILLPYIFISLSILFNYKSSNRNISYIIIDILLICNFGDFARQIYSYDLPTFSILQHTHKIANKKRSIELNNNSNSSTQYVTEIMYLKYQNKHITNYQDSDLLNHTNYKLYKDVYFK